MTSFTRICRLALVPALSFLLLSPSIMADGGGLGHQIQTAFFGSSGSNAKDISAYYCCGGTLGSLVSDGGSVYILSNAHVLGRSGLARSGDDISQPGLIDNSCQIPTNIVADLTKSLTLRSSTNVDAAIAKLRLGMMDETGNILEIGVPSRVVQAPAIGLSVAKSGRTTGLTTGSISAINATVTVQYQKGCGTGSIFYVTFQNQVMIDGAGFSSNGDSGSLIVTNNSCHQPVALLFAGNSSLTVGNPAGEVLTKLGSSLKKTFSFVGTSCVPTATTQTTTTPSDGHIRWPSQEAVDAATAAMNNHLEDLMSLPSVIGAGIGASETSPGEAIIVVYADVTSDVLPELPKRLKDVQVKVVYTDPFIAR